MASLVYLGAVLLFVVIASAVLALRVREPRGIDHAVKAFRKEMNALAPDQRRNDARRGR